MPTGTYTTSDLAPAPQQIGAYSQADLAPQRDFSRLTANPNREGTYAVNTPQGNTLQVPYSNVPVVQRLQGFNLAPYDAKRYAKDFDAGGGNGLTAASLLSGNSPGHQAMDQAAQTVPIHSVGDVASNLGSGSVRVTMLPIAHPINTAMGALKSAAYLGGTAMGVQMPESFNPITPIAEQFAQNPAGEAVAAIPQVALALAGMGAAKSPIGALEDSGGSGGSGGVFRTPLVKDQNYTPTQLRARAAATAYGNTSAGTVPQDLAANTGSILRDTAAQTPDAVAAINSKNPLASVQADIDLHHAAQARIDRAHETILDPVRNRPVDTSAIQQAVQPSPEQLQGMDPADVNVVNRMQARAANVTTLGGLNKFRQFMNTEDTTLRGNPSYAQTIGTPALVHDMANAAREAYYNALQDVTGQDFTGLKRMEGALIKQSAGLQSALPRLSMAEARANAPFDWRNTVGDVLEGTTRSGAPGLPIISGAATKIGEAVKGTKLAQMQRQLQTFYSDLPSQSTIQIPKLRR